MKIKQLLRGILAIVAMTSFIACSDSTVPKTEDSGVQNDTSFQYDITKSDTNGQDSFQWPDQTGIDSYVPQDAMQWPDGTYSGVAFGCQNDSDCLGKLCCPTPWGVKVCATTCNN